MNLKIDFNNRSINYTDEELEAALGAMRDASPLTQGKYLAEFENKFAQYQNVAPGSCFAVMNGCAALEMAAQLCAFNPGDEVVMPSHTFTASCYPFIKHGATPAWADIDLDTRVATASTIEAAISPRTKAVVIVHLYGYVADMPEISRLCRERGLILIEDAAQSIGCTLGGQRAGSFGDMSIFSFHSHKNLTTLGEGGMLYVRDPALQPLVPMLRHNGHCAYSGERTDYWKPAMGNVDLPELHGRPLMPSNYSIGEVECAIGAKLLDRIDAINAQKRLRALAFMDALADYPDLVFHREKTPRHNYHLLAAWMKAGPEARDRFISAMHDEHGVKCVVQYQPLNRYDFYRKLGYGEANCPNADMFYDAMISFPFQHAMSEADFSYMLEASKKTLDDLGLKNAGAS